MEVGEVIKYIREFRGIGQNKLSDMLKMQKQYISFVEKGYTGMRLNTYYKIVKELDLHPSDIMYIKEVLNGEREGEGRLVDIINFIRKRTK